ncbi:MAG TPA: hypothetical protein VGH89_15310 [Pseudonocardia sp.]
MSGKGGTFRAGVARAVITPPVGCPLSGFAGRASSMDVHDELTATALVLSQAGQRVALVCCDLLELSAGQAGAAREAAARLTGIAAASILVSCSHTHYGPVTRPEEELSGSAAPQVAPYLANLTHLLAGVVAAAARRQVPARLAIARTEAVIGINRRQRTASGAIVLGQNPDGPIDRTVGVLRVDERDGRPLAAVLNHACHGVSLGPECTSITADFPSAARRVLETDTGATCLFLQGAAGDINPLLMGGDWSHPEALGVALGAQAVTAFHAAQPLEVELGTRNVHLNLPVKLPASEAAARAELAGIEREEYARDSGIAGEELWRAHRLAKAREAIDILAGRTARPRISAEIAAVRLGPRAGLVSAPAEMFTELGSQVVTASPFDTTLFAGYTNGMIGYVPTRAAYAEGGYEVTHGAEVSEQAGENMVAASVDLLGAVAKAPTPRNAEMRDAR